ncbi:MAG: hypothetical protein L0229_12165 [Blastocatellia bacterium]|nr:hypothetical protein [Blastocatellia bacterium]
MEKFSSTPIPIDQTYSDLLSDLHADSPTLATVLDRAYRNRLSRCMRYAHGATFKGIDELLAYLAKTEKEFTQEPLLMKMQRLVTRARSDFEAGIEALLTGLHSVLFDAMRDVMEIEFLLRDFLIWADHIDEWLNCTEEERYNKFRPAILRQRYATHCGHQPQDMQEATDYKMHSRFLHVTPFDNPIGTRGFVDDDHPSVMGACLWEIMAHAKRIVFLIHRLRHSIPIDVELNPGNGPDLPRFQDAWERCYLRYAMWWSDLDNSS